MSNVFAIIAAIMMMMNMIGGMGDQLPMTAEYHAEVNRENIMKAIPAEAAESAAPVGMVMDILNVIGMRETVDRDTLQLELTAGDKTVVSLALRKDEEGLSVASNLLENTRLNLSAGTVDTIMEQINSSEEMKKAMEQFEKLSKIDEEALTQEMLGHVDNVVAQVKEKAGEYETGDFGDSADLFFHKRAPVEMNDQELATLLLNEAKAVLSTEMYQEIFAMFGENANPVAEIDKALEKIAAREEAQAFDTVVYLYESEDGENFVTADLFRAAAEDRPEETMHIGFGTEYKYHRLRANVTAGEDVSGLVSVDIMGAKDYTLVMDLYGEGNTSVFLNFVQNGDRISGVVGPRINGNFIRALIDVEPEGNDTKATARVITDDENGNTLDLVTFTGTLRHAGEITARFAGDGMETVPVESLMSGDESAQQVLGSLTQKLMAGAMQALGTLIAELPEETAAMLNSLMSGGQQ